jgi:hypothetical protein
MLLPLIKEIVKLYWNQRWNSSPPILAGAARAIKFVVSMAGEAYDAHEQEVQIGNPG